MRPFEDPFFAIDQRHDAEAVRRDAASAAADAEFKRHVAAINTNLAIGHQQTVDLVTEEVLHAIGANGVAEHLVRVAASRPALSAGSMLAGLVKQCVEKIANEAVSKTAGLDMAATRSRSRRHHGASMNWNVTIEYKKGPAFGAIPVIAPTKEQAIAQAKAEALEFGFDQPVKKAVAVAS